MFDFLIIILIFLENSLIVDFPYNVIALPYLTYLAYKKGRNGILQIVLICFVISKDNNIFIEIGIVFIVIFIISHLLTKILDYKEINIVYYSIIQFIIYGTYLYVKLPYFSFLQGMIMFGSYLLLNYSFVKQVKDKV